MTNAASLQSLQERLTGMLVEDPKQHIYRLHRRGPV